MDFSVAELPEWRSSWDVDLPPWNTGVTSSRMKRDLARKPHSPLDVLSTDGLEELQRAYDSTGHISEQALKAVHKALDPGLGGCYRTRPAFTPVLGTRSGDFYYEDHTKIPAKMAHLVRELKLYCQFLKIHPFEDYNGKVSRIAVAVLLRKTLGFHVVLPVTGDANWMQRLLMGYTLQMSQIHGADLSNICAFLLDCCWVATQPRSARSVSVTGLAGSGKTTLVSTMRAMEGSAFITPNYEYKVSEDQRGDVRLYIIDVLSEGGDPEDIRFVLLNKVELLDDELASNLHSFLKEAYPTKLFIPITASKGTNIYRRSSEFNWYDGPTLLEALDAPY